MSSAETTHAVEWKSDGADGERAHLKRAKVGHVWPSALYPGQWMAKATAAATGGSDRVTRVMHFPTASAARAFVERTVREAGR